jgi:formate transporter
MSITVCENCESAVAGDTSTCPVCGAAEAPPGEIRRLPHEVVLTFIEHARDFVTASPGKQVALAFTAGAFITFGAALSVVLTVGIKTPGVAELMLGVGFSAGFALVILSGAALFTEVNVLLPELLLSRGRPSARLWRFWLIAYLGNVVGAVALGAALNGARVIGPEQAHRLAQIIAVKTQFAHTGIEGWFRAVLSGVLANWLVGMAAFLAAAARTVGGKIIGMAVPIVMFVALGVQHAPANMGYFAIGLIHGHVGTNLGTAVAWSIAPATLGNMLGAALFVSLLFWYTYGSSASGRRTLDNATAVARGDASVVRGATAPVVAGV